MDIHDFIGSLNQLPPLTDSALPPLNSSDIDNPSLDFWANTDFALPALDSPPFLPPEKKKQSPSSRTPAEEDRRKRNTAASARFRVKKKQREAHLESAAKEMTDRIALLESRVKELELENKWLKDLLIQKDQK
ncbi:Regulatory protein cys-3 [Neolecta irregularis DAH-3]|uniref:Regulatory protein cys-3 n=1 Tax=Neolecta irregularis (strain DAH-3) TaxID=1198029 RepID=A0A1U7LV53_NEOID|nr:Regulatory protein cys-3 [Neolecta irregularis DAH-3]|eukprot:OLL26556.1 Regulatory protein cys-3 [Neolecta irregularis DAH-3]